MNLSQKCQYALRAVYELATRQGRNPVPVSEIAEVQAIPPRFLELILIQLKQAGYVESRRGVQGGYILTTSPRQLSVGDVIRAIEGPLTPVKPAEGRAAEPTARLPGEHAFAALWDRAHKAVAEVYDMTTFADLIEQEQRARGQAIDYTI